VLIADDDTAVCTAVTRLLKPTCDVVGRVVDVASLFGDVTRLKPDVVLLDFSLPGDLNGLDICRRLKQAVPGVSVLAFTANDDDEVKRAAQDAGFSGFVWKMEVATELLDTIFAVVGRASGAVEDDTA
jgi:DNA-binding NarL/FixJ family response regulator